MVLVGLPMVANTRSITNMPLTSPSSPISSSTDVQLIQLNCHPNVTIYQILHPFQPEYPLLKDEKWRVLGKNTCNIHTAMTGHDTMSLYLNVYLILRRLIVSKGLTPWPLVVSIIITTDDTIKGNRGGKACHINKKKVYCSFSTLRCWYIVFMLIWGYGKFSLWIENTKKRKER